MNVLFIDTVHPALWQDLTKNEFNCIDGTYWDRDEVLDALNDVQGIVIRSKFKIDEEFLDKAKDLRFIARSGSGLENINRELTEKKGIKVFNSPEGNCDAVAEHAMGMLLSLFTNLIRSDREVREGHWYREENRGIELVLAYDKFKSDFGSDHVKEVSYEDILEKSDIISFHVPLTEETRYIADRRFFSQSRKAVYLINTSRGEVVNTDHLVEALKGGLIMGACLDVLEYEKSSFENIDHKKLPDSFKYLTESDQVVLSPHIAGWTFESYERLSTVLATKILGEFK
jgi:D-3-phosphoglycerate dehydrogenase